MYDFVDLALTSRQLIDRALAADDDFAKIENDTGNNDAGSMGMGTSSSPYYGQAISSSDATPFLSKSAEAELYLLATNFLLCKSE